MADLGDTAANLATVVRLMRERRYTRRRSYVDQTYNWLTSQPVNQSRETFYVGRLDSARDTCPSCGFTKSKIASVCQACASEARRKQR